MKQIKIVVSNMLVPLGTKCIVIRRDYRDNTILVKFGAGEIWIHDSWAEEVSENESVFNKSPYIPTIDDYFDVKENRVSMYKSLHLSSELMSKHNYGQGYSGLCSLFFRYCKILEELKIIKLTESYYDYFRKFSLLTEISELKPKGYNFNSFWFKNWHERYYFMEKVLSTCN